MAVGQGRSSGQGVKLLYIRDYLRANTNKDHAKNANKICDFLATKGIEASPKTIYNDIFRLQVDFGEPIEYSAKQRGYYITKPLFEPYELRLIVDSIQSSKFITQSEARSITAKIKEFADVYTKDSLNRTAYVSNRVRSKNDSVVKDVDRIHYAILNNLKIGFRYFHYTPNKQNPKKYSKKGELFVVSPYAFHWDNGNYYLYAYVSEKEGFRSFRVDRMEAITEPIYEDREGADLFRAEHLTQREAKVFQMYHGEKHNVKMRFINRFADAVIDQFGKDIIMIPDGDNHFTVNALIEISPPFFAWISTFGRGVKIISPKPVVEEMKKFIEKVSDMYKDEGEG